MKKLLSVLVFTLLVGFLVVSVKASSGVTQIFGPYASDSPDSSTCGNDWALDTMDRFYKVDTTQNEDGTYNVREEFKNGEFVTLAGHSPGACETGVDNGNTVGAGVEGKFQGSFDLVVTGGTFNPEATCPGACYTSQFVTAFFGAGASYDVPTWMFHYNAKNHGEWKNASLDRGGNQGDITGNL